MLILVSITISIAVNGGLFNYAKDASSQTNQALSDEKNLSNLPNGLTIDQLIAKYTNGKYITAVASGNAELTITDLSQSEYETLINEYLSSIDSLDDVKNYALINVSLNTEAPLEMTFNISSIAEENDTTDVFVHDKINGWQSVILNRIIESDGTITVTLNSFGPVLFIVYDKNNIKEDTGVPPLTTTHLTTGNNLKGYKIYGNSRQNNLPDGYQEVEWINSTAGIDLGIKTNNNMQFEAKYLRTNSNQQYVYYSDAGTSSSTNTTAYASSSAYWRFGGKTVTVPQSVNTIYETIQNKNGVWVNGEKIESYTSVPTFTSSNNLRTFGTISGGSTPPVQLYYLKTKDYGANTYSHIWIPCKRTLDNSYGLYDIVGNEFYTNSEATITAGDDVIPSPNYPIPIESVGDLVTDSSDTNYGKYKIPITVSDGTNSTTTNIYLDEPLRKIGNYADYIDFENGKVMRWFNEVDLGNYNYNNTTYSGVYSTELPYLAKVANWGTTPAMKCNKYSVSYANNLATSGTDILISSTPQANPIFWIKNYSFTNLSLAEIKEALVGTVVLYKRETLAEESITLPTIPSIKGTTIYSVGTRVQPSNMYIKYIGK